MVNQLWWNNDASAGGGVMYVYYDDGNSQQWVPVSPAAVPNAVQQIVVQRYAQTNLVTGTTMPAGSVPTTAMGVQAMSVSITPKMATSRLRVSVSIDYVYDSNDDMIAALFRDGGACIGAGIAWVGGASLPGNINFSRTMAAGSTATTTFTIRMGANSTNGTIGLAGAASWFGGAGNNIGNASITVEEIT
jgi:hypothetical protein